MKNFICSIVLASCLGNLVNAGENIPAGNDKEIVLKVNLDKVIMKDFLGVNGVYHGFAWMPEIMARGYNDVDRQRELDRVKSMELQIARTWYRPDWAGVEGPFDWESPKMKVFYMWLGEMKKLDVDVALQAAWGFPSDTHLGQKSPNPEKDPARFAAWVSESVRQIVIERGFDNVKYLIMMTEPTTSPWGKAPEGLELWPYYVKVIRGVDEQMKLDKTRNLVKLVGPNNHGVGSFEQLRLTESTVELQDVFDIYGAHTYLDPENAYENWRAFMDQVREAVAAAPKPIWLDEYNVLREWETHVRDQPEHGTYLAEVVAASLDARIQTSMIWLLFDQMYTAPADKANNKNSFYNGVHRWGTTKWPNDDIEAPGTPYPAWYAYSMMSKYLGGGEGTNVYKTIGQEGLHINAVRQKNGSWSFLVVNSNKSEKEFTIQFSDKLACKLKRHIYDPAKVACTVEASVPGVDKIFKNVKKNFTDTLPAGAVAVYVTTRLENQ